MNGALFGLLSAFSYSLKDFFIKKGLKNVDKYFLLIFGNLLMVVILFIFALNSKFVFPSLKIFLLIALIGLIGSLALLSFYKALEVGKLAVVSAIASSHAIVPLVLSPYFYNEKLSLLQGIGILFAIFGVVLCSFKYADLKKLKINNIGKGVNYAIFAMVGWGLYAFLQKPSIEELGPAISIFYIECSIVVFSFILFFKKIKRNHLKKKEIKYFIGISLLLASAVLFLSYGISYGKVSIVAALGGLSPIMALFFSTFLLKEKITLNQKIGIFLSVIGVVLISL